MEGVPFSPVKVKIPKTLTALLTPNFPLQPGIQNQGQLKNNRIQSIFKPNFSEGLIAMHYLAK